MCRWAMKMLRGAQIWSAPFAPSGTVDGAIEAGTMFAGTPDQVFAQMQEDYQHVGGYGHLLIMGQAGFLEHDETVRGIKLFAREVLPRLQEFRSHAMSAMGSDQGRPCRGHNSRPPVKIDTLHDVFRCAVFGLPDLEGVIAPWHHRLFGSPLTRLGHTVRAFRCLNTASRKVLSRWRIALVGDEIIPPGPGCSPIPRRDRAVAELLAPLRSAGPGHRVLR